LAPQVLDLEPNPKKAIGAVSRFNERAATIRRANGPLAPAAPHAYVAKSIARDRDVVLLLVLFILAFVVPIAASTVLYLFCDRIADWKSADRSSAGLLPPALAETGAVVRIFSARTVRWRGIVASHSWIVVKEAGAAGYNRFDYTAWGEPIWIDRFVPDGRWFGRAPELIFAADGSKAEKMTPRIRRNQTVEQYRAFIKRYFPVLPAAQYEPFVE
jgi:hypothetical protein